MKQFIAQSSKDYLLIDFWASWCIPCREESPYFEKMKNQFIEKNVVFLSLSLDEDKKINEWKNALKDDGLLKSTNQYKLLSPEISPLFKNFKISAIPRYVLLDSNGQFIDFDFLRPSDKNFESKLISLIKSKKN